MRDLNVAENVWEKKENLQSWVASTYVTTNSVNLLRQSLEQVYRGFIFTFRKVHFFSSGPIVSMKRNYLTFSIGSRLFLSYQPLLKVYQENGGEHRTHDDSNGNLSPLEKLKIHNEKMYKIEALFILTLLLCGNYKDNVQKQVSKLSLIPGLNKVRFLTSL